jgi:hypothetical protein
MMQVMAELFGARLPTISQHLHIDRPNSISYEASLPHQTLDYIQFIQFNPLNLSGYYMYQKV